MKKKGTGAKSPTGAGGFSTAYRDRWASLALLAPLAMLVVCVIASINEREIWSREFKLAEDEEAEVPDLQLPHTLIGAVRIEARAAMPTNRWAAYQISLLDPQDTPLLELVKDAWAESGDWREGGESGTWAEDDTELLWDVRAGAPETVKLEVSVLETGTAYEPAEGSRPPDWEQPEVAARFSVPIAVTVRAGVTDGRFLVMGLILSLAFALLAYYLAGHGGRAVIVEQSDGEVKGRALMGGPGQIVSVTVSGLVDETAPPAMHVRIVVRDESGNQAYDGSQLAAVTFRKDDGDIEDGRFRVRIYLPLPRRASWGVFVETTPDRPIEHVKLIVRDRATSRGEITIEPVTATAEGVS